MGKSWALWLPFVLRVSRQEDQGILLVLGVAAPSVTAFVLDLPADGWVPFVLATVIYLPRGAGGARRIAGW